MNDRLPQYILLDIEGTTTDIAFVHQVLFPYAAERLAAYVAHQANTPEVQDILNAVRDTVQSETGASINAAGAVETLLAWIQADRKHTALKRLQGMIWQAGFESGHYQGHVYPDVPPALARWQAQGIRLGIYSSGSTQAQQLLFRHSVAGDLTACFSHYFDTTVGGKQETASYAAIARELGLAPERILFLSDVEAELDAAWKAGFQTRQLIRAGQVPSERHPASFDFTDVPAVLQPVSS